MTVLLAYWTARRAEEKPALYGIATGLVAAVVLQLVIHLLYPPVTLEELLVYLVFGLAGGWVGGLEGGKTSAGREALYRVSRNISEAKDPRGVVSAIGRGLDGYAVRGVVLCRSVFSGENRGEGFSFEAEASWASRGREAWPGEARPVTDEMPGLSRILQSRSVALRGRDLPSVEREVWRRLRIDHALIAPLADTGGTPVGTLVVTFAKGSPPHRTATRELLTVGAQAALTLENMRLMEQDRRATLLAERQRLSDEIHDTLAQGFTSISMNLAAMEMASPRTFDEDPRLRRYFEGARRSAQENLSEVRRLVQALRPELLDRYPLDKAVGESAGAWSAGTGVEARVSVCGAPRQLTPEVEIALFRAVQESLANVQKHARADTVTVTLTYDDGQTTLEVRDDGGGFDPARLKNGGVHSFGLRSMRERVVAVGGSFSVESAPGTGTRLLVTVPTTSDDPTVTRAGATAFKALERNGRRE
ncbi:MAG: hypothetical protein AVDCRST_MAG22-168 [uncultured Rubrobacteraceae bacterium]|uniref:Histidine kinase domain-containing protein n=1 Tax=uncultured Rubrobacteraceae bacterium TaxID=349277 RepID=A0A6J4NCZ4_9ACTN|nr:MAG: hypothetical protein AVDCRST_MAG22-168 [uncultured Rubrobacteraceae bacterium]